MSCPEVDVVVLSWNRMRTTLETLENVIAQRGVAPYLWVVDQGSGPEQLAALRRFRTAHDRVEVLELQHNVGIPAGLNLGIRAGGAAWVVKLDNDAVLADRDALRRVVTRFRQRPAVGALAFRARNYFTGGQDRTMGAYPAVLRRRWDQEFPTARFVGVGFALRRTAFERTGGFDDRLFFCEEERDLAYKLIQQGYAILYDPTITVLHKLDPERRIRWEGGRLRLQVRNALYIHYRHHRRLLPAAAHAAGWVVRGARNRAAGQALAGVAEAWRMCREAREELRAQPPLSPVARRYLREHDGRHRGSLLTRIRREALGRLPGR